MAALVRLRADHAAAVLAFERANRAYFADFISDRGEQFFTGFTELFGGLLAEQATGTSAFHVLVAEDRSVLGRFNLVDIAAGSAVLGYRVAQQSTGRGVATAGVLELCHLASTEYGLRTLRAATSDQHVASQRVLIKSGFRSVGLADPAQVGGKVGTWYQREL